MIAGMSKTTRPTVARQRWTEVEARRVLEEWRESGLPLQTFARERGMTPQRLYWWRSRLGGEGAVASRHEQSPNELVPIRIRGVEATGGGVSVRLPTGLVLDVEPSARPDWVCALARALMEV